MKALAGSMKDLGFPEEGKEGNNAKTEGDGGEGEGDDDNFEGEGEDGVDKDDKEDEESAGLV